MAQVTPARRARAYAEAARCDSLVRNSLFLMSSTVATAALGYVFWIVAARVFSTAEIGVASAVISMCSTAALLTYLGPAAMLIERLHAYEGSQAWTSYLVRMCLVTAAVTALAAAVFIFLIGHSDGYRPFFATAGAVPLAVVGAASWTVVNLCCSAFVAARRADGQFAAQGLTSLLKVLLLVPLCMVGFGIRGIVTAWVASSLVGVAACGCWLLPRLGLGNGTVLIDGAQRQPQWRGARHARPSRMPRLRGTYLQHLVGQHLTSVGGQLTPLILPILVVTRLGGTQNAQFYLTWMIGSVFFMVSPSISTALFAETARAAGSRPRRYHLANPVEGRPKLRATVVKAFRVMSLLLIPAMVITMAGGRLILDVFGQTYARSGYGLLVLLALSAVPDAVSNVAVAVCRTTSRLGYSAAINLGILVVTASSAWYLMPRFGLLGIGAGWLGAQVLGALASIPAFLSLRDQAA